MKMANLKVEVKADTSDIEKALERVKKAMDDVSKSAIVISVEHATEKKWWQFWK